jgi:redox-sensitive bicupin YhaK (pirin superfamily)
MRTAIAERFAPVITPRERQIAQVTSGRRHGPITRLASPGDIGELIKPFVFLDYAEVVPRPEPLFGIHPHSGIATPTTILSEDFAETTGRRRRAARRPGMDEGGNGVWRRGATPGEPLRVFQLWRVPPSENSAAEANT